MTKDYFNLFVGETKKPKPQKEFWYDATIRMETGRTFKKEYNCNSVSELKRKVTMDYPGATLVNVEMH